MTSRPSDSLSLQRLLGELPVAAFLAEYYQRTPLRRDCGPLWEHPSTHWGIAQRALEASGEDLLIARDGSPWPGPTPPSLEELQRLHRDGYSIAVRRADRYDGALAHMARALATELHGRINLHVYFTQPGPGGFGWHFDPEEVFLFQAKGAKRFSVQENTQQPWPRLETMDTSLSAKAETTPIIEYEIARGSWLYIPAGFWHRATVLDDSITISLGLLTPSVLEAFELVRSELLRSARWRRRLPPLGSASGLSDEERSALVRRYFRELAEEISSRLDSEDLPAKFFGATGWWARR